MVPFVDCELDTAFARALLESCKPCSLRSSRVEIEKMISVNEGVRIARDALGGRRVRSDV
jgi:hypothetical protein